MLREYLKLAVGNLTHRKVRSILTMIGIFIGIAAVVALISLGQGMQQAIENQFSKLGADKITIQTKGVATGPPGSNNDVMLTTNDLDVIRRSGGVESAAGRLIEPITVTFNRKTIFTYVASIPDNDINARDLVLETANLEMIAGRQLKASDQNAVVVGESYMTSPKFNNRALGVGDQVVIDGQKVQVVGVFKNTGNPIWDMSLLMNERPIRDLTDIKEKYGIIIAKVSSSESMQVVAENIKKDLRKHRNVKEGKEDFTVSTPEETAKTFQTVLSIIQGVLIGIAAISLLVGGIGIMNTMYTSVRERRREIGIMKAIGAKNSEVMLIFLIESGILGLIGGAIGIILGVGFSKLVEIIATVTLGTALIQAYFPLYLIIGSLMFSVGVGTAAGMLPAYQASRLPPVEALRQ
jgi:putative ABC transport system permease protein